MIDRRTPAGSDTTSCPATSAWPRSGRVSVDRMSTIVVLPAPLGPSKPSTSPRPTLKLMSRSATTEPKVFRDPVDDYGIIGAGHSASPMPVSVDDKSTRASSSPAESISSSAIASRVSSISAVEKPVGKRFHYRSARPGGCHTTNPDAARQPSDTPGVPRRDQGRGSPHAPASPCRLELNGSIAGRHGRQVGNSAHVGEEDVRRGRGAPSSRAVGAYMYRNSPYPIP